MSSQKKDQKLQKVNEKFMRIKIPYILRRFKVKNVDSLLCNFLYLVKYLIHISANLIKMRLWIEYHRLKIG